MFTLLTAFGRAGQPSANGGAFGVSKLCDMHLRQCHFLARLVIASPDYLLFCRQKRG